MHKITRHVITVQQYPNPWNARPSAIVALHGLVGTGLRLNEEADAIGPAPTKGAPAPARSAEPPRANRSRWMA